MTAGQPVRSTTGRLDRAAVAEVLALAEQTAAADDVHPLSEDAVLRLRGTPTPDADPAPDADPGTGADPGAVVHLMSRSGDGTLAGYALVDAATHADGAAGELFVHPAHRRRGHGLALLRAAVAAGSSTSVGRLRIWAHGDHPAARALAKRAGFERVRVLWQMRRPLTGPLPAAPLPDGVSIRAFRPGADDAAWLAVNGRAFAHHPEQGRWDAGDLRLRMAEPWFDPAGFLLAVDAATDRLLGFHWTKVHPATRRADGSHQDAIGEIYVLGVDPTGHRRGLGAVLSLAGLQHLRDRGLTEVLLYVDEANAGAVALYERLGFTVWSTDVSYEWTGA